jgi:T4 RnlA family RNA ligase
MTPAIATKLREHGLDYLKDDPDELAIKHRIYESDGLLVLNYCQIQSPKLHPVIQECRGLILSLDGFDVVSRCFDRFFNFGEGPNEHFDIEPGDVIVEKVDGSLIKLYHWDGRWHVSTRGTAFAEADTPFGRTFAEVVQTAAPRLLCEQFLAGLSRDCTYIFELVSPENRVVKTYDSTALVYLATRDNRTGEYCSNARHMELHCGIRGPRVYRFDTAGKCLEAAKNLPDLEEGYVVYRSGRPVCKIKSPTYVAAHRLFSGPMTTKRAVELLLTGEADELIAYFPEFKDTLGHCARALKSALTDMDRRFAIEWNAGASCQKDFALRVKDLPYSAVLFQARNKGLLPSEAFAAARENVRVQVALDAVGASEEVA